MTSTLVNKMTMSICWRSEGSFSKKGIVNLVDDIGLHILEWTQLEQAKSNRGEFYDN